MDLQDISFSWPRPKPRDRTTYYSGEDIDGKPVFREQTSTWSYQWRSGRLMPPPPNGSADSLSGLYESPDAAVVQRFLTTPDIMGGVKEGRLWKDPDCEEDLYRPLEENTALFKELVAIEVTEESISCFAAKYGLLDGRYDFEDEVPIIPSSQRHPFTTQRPRSDSFKLWKDCILRLRICTEIWQATQEGRRKVPYIEVLGTYRKTGQVPVLAELDGIQIRQILPAVKSSEIPRFFLLSEVTQQLSGAASLSFVPTNGVGFRTAIVPSTLRHAIWLQFAIALSNKKTYRECAVCGKPFEISPRTARTNKTLCSEACKFRGYRQRKATVKQLRAEGRTLREIAKTVGTDLEKVKRWLGEEDK